MADRMAMIWMSRFQARSAGALCKMSWPSRTQNLKGLNQLR